MAGFALFIALLALIALGLVLGLRIDALAHRIGAAESGVRRLAGFQAEALALESARGRFRRRQQRVERMVDSGALGVEGVHRTLAGRLGWGKAGERVYPRLRGLNRTIGRGVSGLFAPKTAQRRRQSLAEWRAGRAREDVAPDAPARGRERDARNDTNEPDPPD